MEAGAARIDEGILGLIGCFTPHRPVEAGAATGRSQLSFRWCSFTPHRPVEAGAAYRAIHAGIVHRVSILTGPWRPVLLQRLGIGPGRNRFNPHRPVEAGAAQASTDSGLLHHRFNPHRPVEAGAACLPPPCRVTPLVSILTGPWRPVLHAAGALHDRHHRVSILTGPWRPVLRALAFSNRMGEPFQSSPARGGRCCDRMDGGIDGGVLFQSSPARGGRCCILIAVPWPMSLHVSILTGPWRPVLRAVLPLLQRQVQAVSILTGPWRPVLLVGSCTLCGAVLVSILTGPWRPVLRPSKPGRETPWPCFNPHRPVEAGAAVMA